LNILENNSIKFKTQYKLINKTLYKTVLYADFYLPDYKLIIEFNGLQHYEAIEFFGGLDSFKKQQERDIIKANICKKLGLYIHIIKYNDIIKDKR